MYALYVCLRCMPYICVLDVCFICALMHALYESTATLSSLSGSASMLCSSSAGNSARPIRSSFDTLYYMYVRVYRSEFDALTGAEFVGCTGAEFVGCTGPLLGRSLTPCILCMFTYTHTHIHTYGTQMRHTYKTSYKAYI